MPLPASCQELGFTVYGAARRLERLGSEANHRRSSPPQVIADAIGKAVTARRPKTRYAVGFGARPLIASRRLMSDRAFDRLITRTLGVTN